MNSWVDKALTENFTKAPAWLNRLRQEGRDSFKTQGFPTSAREDWKYTSVQGLADGDFQTNSKIPTIGGESLVPHLYGGADAWRLVFVNGSFAPQLSHIEGIPEGVIATGLRATLEKQPELLETHLGKFVDIQKAPFSALNLGGFSDGAFIRIPHGVILNRTLEILHLCLPNGQAILSQPRNLIVAEGESQAVILETYAGQGAYLTNAVTELALEPGAILDHYKLQSESELGTHLAATAIRQGRQSLYRSFSVSLGAKLSRNEISTLLAEEGAACILNGLYVVGGNQHVDNQTNIDHAKPHCTSSELYKGILGGQSQGVFNGRILVRPDAQKTQARQTNKNLILSKEAIVNTKPLLEIYANDVKCNHGATIGRLDENQIFYLRSRGIGKDLAKNLLTYAFAGELLREVRIPALKAKLENFFMRRLELGQELLVDEVNS